MLFSFLKTLGENVLYSMNLRPGIAGRKAGDFRNRSRIHAFQIQEHDLPIEGPEPVDKFHETFQKDPLLAGPSMVGLVRQAFDFFEGDQRLQFGPMFADDIRCGRVVRYSVDPRGNRATTFKIPKAIPEGEVNFLQEVSPFVGIPFVSLSDPAERIAIRR